MPSSKLGKASLTIRCTEKELREIHKKAEEHNFKSMAEYVRFCALNAEIKVIVGGKEE